MSFPEPTVGAIVINDEGKILLAKSPKFYGLWIVAGGHVELGETIEHAIKREVEEELGIQIEVDRLLTVQDFIFDPSFHKKKHFIFLDFLCRYISGEPKVDGRELTELKWFTPEEALEANIDGYTRRSIEAYLNKLPPYDNKPRETE